MKCWVDMVPPEGLALVQEPSSVNCEKEEYEQIIQSPFCDLHIHSVAEGMRKVKFKGETNGVYFCCKCLSSYAHNCTELPGVRQVQRC